MARKRNADSDDSHLPIGPMDEKTFRGFLKELDTLQAAVEDAAAEVKTARSSLSAKWKEFKKQGGKADAMRECMQLRKMDEGDLIQHEEDRKRYGLWMKLPFGTQPDLLDDLPGGLAVAPPAPVEAPLTERSRRGPRGPKLVENVTGSPLN